MTIVASSNGRRSIIAGAVDGLGSQYVSLGECLVRARLPIVRRTMWSWLCRGRDPHRLRRQIEDSPRGCTEIHGEGVRKALVTLGARAWYTKMARCQRRGRKTKARLSETVQPPIHPPTPLQRRINVPERSEPAVTLHHLLTLHQIHDYLTWCPSSQATHVFC